MGADKITNKPKKNIKKRLQGTLRFVLILLVGLVLGFALRSCLGSSSTETPEHAHTESTEAQAATVWTCSMHPQIRQPEPGPCPLCGMDLIPLKEDASSGGDDMRVFHTSEAAMSLMDIQTSEAVHRFVDKEVRMIGKVNFDETQLRYITAWVPGRIDRLFVDFTGVEVSKGDHMVELYSPELLTAQDELRRAANTVKQMNPNAPEILKQTSQTTLNATREKLRRWGLTDAQIKTAETGKSASDHIIIYAPAGGTVIHRSGQEGMYVETGSRIYTIANLDSVWVELDAYESQIQWIHYGQTVTFTTESYPGEAFEGKIAFIEPVLNESSRTVKVRVNVPNKDGRLKPEMFLRATVKSKIASSGRVMDPELSGKWISPMHPEIIKDGPGDCDVCGMALVRAEDLGYVSADAPVSEMPLIIPASAPLITGTRAIVYVQIPNADKPTFEGREIVLGPRAGEFYIVKEGLLAGERVVTNGNFKIDSALQIHAKPSMMTPGGGGGDSGHKHEDSPTALAPSAPHEFQEQLGKVYEAYLTLQDTLAKDNFEGAQASITTLKTALAGVKMEVLDGESHVLWMKEVAVLQDAIAALAAATSIDAIRLPLAPLSEALWTSATALGLKSEQPLHQAHCPMALDGVGANWLQASTEVSNPYYGVAMPKCGSIVNTLALLDPETDPDSAHAEHERHE